MTWVPALRRVCLFVAIVGSTGAQAQIVTTTPVTPPAKYISPGGVDMRTGEYVAASLDLSIGPEYGGLTFERIPGKLKVFRSNWHYQVTRKTNPEGGYHYQVENRDIAKTWFSLSGTTFQEVGFTLNGTSKLELINNSYLRYTAPDGTTVSFQGGVNTWAQEIKHPDGLTYALSYDTGGPSGETTRLRRVTSNTGYELLLEYFASPDNGKISKVCAINLAVTTPPVAHACPVVSTRPSPQCR